MQNIYIKYSTNIQSHPLHNDERYEGQQHAILGMQQYMEGAYHHFYLGDQNER